MQHKKTVCVEKNCTSDQQIPEYPFDVIHYVKLTSLTVKLHLKKQGLFGFF